MSDFTDAVEANARRTVKLMEDKKALKAKVARLEARIEEVERERDAHEEMSQENYDNACARADEAEADLLLAAQQNTRLSERLDRLEGALREIAEWRGGHASGMARAALAEEPYADVPGAGQRGC